MMSDTRALDHLKDFGSGKPATEDGVCLYRQAFDRFGAAALWSTRQLDQPTMGTALTITESPRVEGNREARRLAEQIEQACRAAL